MKQKSIFSVVLVVVFFFSFLNLFGISEVSLPVSNPEVGSLEHEWIITPEGVYAKPGTYMMLIQTGNTSFEWVVLSCPDGQIFNCELGLCVPISEACGCYGLIF